MTIETLHELLSHNAKVRPDHDALVDGDRSMSWAELDRYANQIGHALVTAGVLPGDRVVLRVAKSLEAVASAYGIMKAGAAYVPLDTAEPADRSRHAIADAEATVAVAEPNRAGRWAHLDGAGLRTVVFPAGDSTEKLDGAEIVDRRQIDEAPTAPLEVSTTAHDLAYVLYTSGSTGTRKGVMLRHRNGMAFVRWAAQAANLTADDRLSSHAPLHFDLSVFDLYAAASVGATTFLVPNKASMFPATLAEFIATNKLTVWYSVPTILRLLVERAGLTPGDLPHLRTIIFAGEVYPVDQLRDLMTLFPSAEYWNWFGPTETNVCTAYQLAGLPEGEQPVPIGTAASDAELLILDQNNVPVAAGEQGELCVAGPTVHAGYWKNPERTQMSLEPHPFREGEIMCRTGDLVRQDPDGNLRFDGRSDHQIKSRGYRVELGDIEAALHSHPSVVEAVVVAVPDARFTNTLHAFVVANADERDHIVSAMRRSLPSYMMPTISLMPDLPRTLNHKVDRQLLTQQASAPDDA